jgi:hypothetical protein
MPPGGGRFPLFVPAAIKLIRYPAGTSQQGRSGFAPANRIITRPLPLTPGLEARKPAPMTTLETVTTAAEHRCEALTISDIPPYRCTTSATADRRGRAVCACHAHAPRIRWFDDAAD